MDNINNDNDLIENPLIYHKDLNYELDDVQIRLNKDNIWKYYKHVFILYNKSKKIITEDIYKFSISKKKLEETYKSLLIHKTSIKLLKNNNHFNNLIITNNIFLEQFNIFEYELENTNLVVPILNIKYEDLLLYLEQYEPINTLINVFKLDTLNTYFNKYTNLDRLLDNLEECNYWSKLLKLNINNKFKNKVITFNISRLPTHIGNIIINIINNNINNNTNGNYIKELEINNEQDVDIENRFTYKINDMSNDIITRDNINQLYDSLSPKHQLKLYCNLLMSKKYCHLAINNYYLLSKMINEIKALAPLFRYLLSYVWIKLYLDEINIKYLKSDNDIIFDLDTASLLPVYPFIHKYPKLNPYMPILVSDTLLKPCTNICGIEDYNIASICNTDEFKIRLNIFISRTSSINILENINFQKYDIAITGSVMTACCQKYNLNINIFNNNKSLEDVIYKHFEEYYYESDIDIMFKTRDNYIYINNVYNFYDDLKISLKNVYKEKFNNNDITIKLNKTNYFFVNEYFIMSNIHFTDNNKNNNKFKYINDNITSEEITNMFKPFYDKLLKIKLIQLNEIFDIDKYPDIYIDNCDFKIYISKSNNYYIDFSYKYKISSKFLYHDFELFNIKNDDFLTTVSKFHLPCVRAFYDGFIVKCTPSFISAHLTKMNIDYRYIHGTQDPFHIINKNRMRGFGLWLNKKDINLLTEYNRKHDFWKNLYDDNVIGTLSLNNKLFKPRFYNLEYYMKITDINITINRYNDGLQLPISSIKHFINHRSITNIIMNRFNSRSYSHICNFDTLIAINDKGNIYQLKIKYINHFIDSYI